MGYEGKRNDRTISGQVIKEILDRSPHFNMYVYGGNGTCGDIVIKCNGNGDGKTVSYKGYNCPGWPGWTQNGCSCPNWTWRASLRRLVRRFFAEVYQPSRFIMLRLGSPSRVPAMIGPMIERTY